MKIVFASVLAVSISLVGYSHFYKRNNLIKKNIVSEYNTEAFDVIKNGNLQVRGETCMGDWNCGWDEFCHIGKYEYEGTCVKK